MAEKLKEEGRTGPGMSLFLIDIIAKVDVEMEELMTMLHDVQSQWHQLGTFLKVQNIDRSTRCNTSGYALATIKAIVDALESPISQQQACWDY